ncbi:Uncharacterized conserved protein, DUF1330 family [Thalassolituus maritimus]|uniref:Uncharacterized conserved protein, DUF1330 family n=1 Tax=Thalassolituus maritimus TaxID=484498 RepID=A0A1N7Q8A2_9GAMM|nr:DUF1330 domain-containing protein [Thalassolituus maritimus]SIT19090.1 Uncharacterized conserved protein, DUF1330 family [Thalassolituus maritimus]
MSGYIIYHYNIIDEKRIDQLGPLSLPIVEKYSGKLVVGSGVRVLEGSPYTNMVIYKFKSIESAKVFYESKEAQELSKLRNEITEGIVVFVPEYGAEQ